MTRPPVSLWDETSMEPALTNPMDGDATCDLAIVGGGYSGLSTALHGAEKGLDCHVLEAESIGFGGSGRNVGLVNAGLWLPPQEVCDSLGQTAGTALVERMGRAPDDVFALIEKHAIRCEPTRSGTIHAAHSPRGLKELEARAEAWHRLGAPVDLLSAAETAELTGTSAFHGGLRDRRAGTIDPMGYTRGLARAALAAGARLATGARVAHLARENGRWKLVTPNGTLTARHVALCTNAYSDTLWPGLREAYVPIRFFQLATEPLGDRAAHILPEGQGLWTTAPVMAALRRDASGRLIIGAMGSVRGGTRGLSHRWGRHMLKRLYPELGEFRFESAWHGDIALTADHIFRIHRLDEGLFAPTCYNGRGITTGTIFGQALAEFLTGAPESALPVPFTEPTSALARSLKAAFYESAFTAHQLYQSI
ncbi:FAD-binding oxidoreductase [Tropicimonas sp. TH_r6]|uniref:NAD(P)/FAD-dependent oxidoreductase n=1 Tax=Tropicimonas sp. TH_r6 TaxID=3082085 RepID=UPI002955A21B|nr:FAD-binding oxidoreductase [Tropicimonas sp. TH_r6]MDV7142095.1 FAD-binding oxidoreductase [Tropicimonas sp. TH_r6]